MVRSYLEYGKTMKQLTLLLFSILITTQLYSIGLPILSQSPEQQYKAICKQAGCEYVGLSKEEDLGDEIIESMVYFNHAVSHSTLLIPVSEFNLESLNKKLREHEMKFEVKQPVEVDYDNATPIMPTLNDFKGIVTEQMKESITQIKAVLGAI